MEIAFVQAPRQNRFFLELVEALRDEVERHAVATSLHWGAFPPPRPDLVYLLLPPHEYFALMHGRVGPDDAVLARTIFVCAEQPGSSWFERNAELVHRAGAVFDINRLAIREYERLGAAAQHLALGWTPRWNRIDDTIERDIDVLFMGCASDRRLEYLSRYAATLWRRRCHYVLSDNSRPNWRPSGSFVADDDKWDLLTRSKVLINLHQDETPYFEWLRIVQAMANGCAVVTEESVDYAPLVPGRHFLSGRPETLGLLAEHLLEDGHARWRMATAAYEHVRHEQNLESAGRALAEAAHELGGRPVPGARTPFFVQPASTEADADRVLKALEPTIAVPPDDSVRRALKGLKLDLVDLRRRLDALGRADSPTAPPAILVDRRSAGYRNATPRISVLVTLHNYREHIGGALDSIAGSTVDDWEIIVVDDASTDGSTQVVRRWIDQHPRAPVLLLRHPVNRGLAHARNAALAFARGRLCFVLDADNEVYPSCLERLSAALDADPGAAFAFGLLERFSWRGSVGLLNAYPWDPARLRAGNHIDAMAMLRTERLRHYGGYRLDRRLHGWEDYDLWCRMAEGGDHGAHVKTVVARYRTTAHSMLSMTNISVTDALSVIAETSPRVMAGEPAG